MPFHRISEVVPNRPAQLYIGGLIQRLERERDDWSKRWKSASEPSEKVLAQFSYWAWDREIKKLNGLWDRGIQVISKSDYAKMRSASNVYVTSARAEEIAKLEARAVAQQLAERNRELAGLHAQTAAARAKAAEISSQIAAIKRK